MSAAGVLAAAPWPGSGLRVTRVRTFLTAPAGVPLCIVRVETNEPGLYGLGCAAEVQRCSCCRPWSSSTSGRCWSAGTRTTSPTCTRC